MVFCFHNCFDRKQNFLKLSRKYLRFTRTIYSNSESSEQFLKQNAFLTYSRRFLRFNTLEQFRNLKEKLESA